MLSTILIVLLIVVILGLFFGPANLRMPGGIVGVLLLLLLILALAGVFDGNGAEALTR